MYTLSTANPTPTRWAGFEPKLLEVEAGRGPPFSFFSFFLGGGGPR